MARGHDYKLRSHGRSLTSRNGVGGQTHVAHLQCSRCPTVGDVSLRRVMPPEQIDQKFHQHGWRTDPHICPNCVAAKIKDKAMATKPAAPAAPAKLSPAVMMAQVEMIQLLAQHFDPNEGRFATDWSDAKIATATGMHEDVVADYRRTAFGDIKEPSEITAIREELTSLERLVSNEVAALRGRLDAATKAMGIRA